jgi:hypothetical protein
VASGCAQAGDIALGGPPQPSMDGTGNDAPDAGADATPIPVAGVAPAYQGVGAANAVVCNLAGAMADGVEYSVAWLADGKPYPEDFATALGPETLVMPDDSVPAQDLGLAWQWSCTITARDGEATVVSEPSVATVDKPQDCSTLLAAIPSTIDGNYAIDVDGPSGPMAPLFAFCDMTTDGGGWTMVLNYVHRGGTNPPLDVRTSSLPTMGAGTLGDDESASASWGHASPAMMSALYAGRGVELRFFGQTSAHQRIMHFKTLECSDYFAAGIGNCKFIGTAAKSSPLVGHSTTLPGFFADEAETGLLYKSDKGDFAMTEQPFLRTATAHWAIRSNDRRWEIDDYPNDESNSTVHRIFVRPL